MPNIVVINESTVLADAHVAEMTPAFEQQWNQDLQPIWGVETAAFTIIPKTQAPDPATWWVVFLDDSDQADALAYHDLTNEGLPISKVFVKTIQADNSSVSVGATHEICEMAVDPWLNSAYQDSKGVFWAGEVCDPVEDQQYGYQIGSVLVTDFVTPNWFGHKNPQTQIDLKNHATTAFQVLSGGYAQHFDPNKGWVQVTGAQAMLSDRRNHAGEGTRRERRARAWQTGLKRSERRW
jgi:hypothetical protein